MGLLRERTFDAGVVTISYVEGPPSGAPLVLLHGGGDSWQYLMPILPALGLRWHIYALDLRGHGKSGRVPGGYRPDQYAEDVVAFLRTGIAEPAILFGHSLGAWVALLAAAERSEQVRALILADPPLPPERWAANHNNEKTMQTFRATRKLARSGLSVRQLAATLASMPVSLPGQEAPVRQGDLPGMDGAYLRGLAKTLSQVDPDVAQYHAEGRMSEYVEHVNVDAALRKMTCPVLLVRGNPSRGGAVPDSEAEHALSLLADGVHVKLEGVGHDLGMRSWEVAPLLRALTSFLESL